MKESPAKKLPVRGYSLIELLLVLAIVAMLASIAVPRFAGAITRQRADGLARRVVADLRLAQRHAKRAGIDQTCWFKIAENGYTLVGMLEPDRPTAEYTVRMGDDPYGGTLESFDLGTDDKIVFDMYGVPDSAGSIAIRVGDEYRTITIDPDTGEASIQ
jgi:prepilin-type N-terminal cleavage/methylation domain-containing protein